MANAIQQLNTVAMKKVVEEEKGAVLVRLYQPHDTARENLTYIILCNVYNEHLRHHRENPEDNFETSLKIGFRALCRFVNFSNLLYH